MPTATELIRKWAIPVPYGLYSAWGNFFHVPRQYPAALIDLSGYVVFPDRASLDCPGIRVAARVNIPAGIKSLFEYVTFPVPSLPEEVPESQFFEGACSRITINRYERDPRARDACIAHYGHRCAVCGVLLSEIYGPVADSLIHVHHLKPLAAIGSSYQLDPIQDLRPVCPNCHAVIHRHDPPFSIEELQQKLNSTSPP